MSDRAYRTAAYTRMKRLLAEQDIPCYWCMTARATTPDHLIPKALGGDDGDLVASCAPCNLKRGGRLGQQLKKARRHNQRSLLRPWP